MFTKETITHEGKPEAEPQVYDLAGVVELLREQCKPTQFSWCLKHGVHPVHVSEILNHKAKPGPKVLAALGLERVISYRRAA